MERIGRSGTSHPAIASTWTGLVVLAGVGVVGVYALDNGAALLLLGAPFLSGFATAFVRNETAAPAHLRRSLASAMVALGIASVGLVCVTHEGVLVVLLGLPPAVVLSGLGALMGHSTVAHGSPSMGPVIALMMCWPLLAAAETEHVRPRRHEVRSIIDVERLREPLSQQALELEIGAPAEWYFIAGVARPQPAREFRLRTLADGRTRIEARTWYTLDMYPDRYWRLWSDAIIHRMHMRMLAQIKRQAEQRGLEAAPDPDPSAPFESHPH